MLEEESTSSSELVSTTFGVLPAPDDSTSESFAGMWQGSFVIENNLHMMTLIFDSNLSGTLTDNHDGRIDTHQNISGSVSNGILSFAVPLSDSNIGDPDCANWDLNCSGTLYEGPQMLLLTCSGIVCSVGGGEYINISFTLDKQ